MPPLSNEDRNALQTGGRALRYHGVTMCLICHLKTASVAPTRATPPRHFGKRAALFCWLQVHRRPQASWRRWTWAPPPVCANWCLPKHWKLLHANSIRKYCPKPAQKVPWHPMTTRNCNGYTPLRKNSFPTLRLGIPVRGTGSGRST